MTICEILLSVIIGLVTGIISGCVSGYIVSSYFERKENEERKKEGNDKLRNKILEYRNQLLTEALLLREGDKVDKCGLQALIMNRDNYINANTKHLYRTIKGEDYFDKILSYYFMIKKEVDKKILIIIKLLIYLMI